MDIVTLYQHFLTSKGICTDSREPITNGIFFALKGANFNGNNHALQALDDGCRYAVVDEFVADDGRLILVDSVLETLQELGRHHRRMVAPLVIGITGSNGKTTTKELMHAVVAGHKRTHATSGNYNNHIGVPLTLLAMPTDTEVAIIEMGANHVGEIAELCDICEPEWGIITNIGKAHLEGFGSFEGVKQAKGELYVHIKEHGGKLLVCADNSLLMELSEGAERSTYGTTADAQVQGKCTKELPFLEIAWAAHGVNHLVSTRLSGLHNLENILCAIAMGVELQVPAELTNAAIAGYLSENNRSQWVETAQNKVLLDAYNANPSSMELAVANFAKRMGETQLYLLGDMKELGEFSEAEHLKVIEQVRALGKEAIYVGPEFAKVVQDEKHCISTTDLIEMLKREKPTGRQILIKGSRGIALEKVMEVL